MLERGRDLGCNILKQAAAAGDVHGLHASADAEQGDIGPPRQVDHVQFKIRATFAHDSEGIALALTIQRRWKVRAASGEEESVNLLEETSSRGPVCMEWKDQRNAAEFFDGANVTCAQKIGGLAPAHSFRSPALKSGVTPMIGFIVYRTGSGAGTARCWCISVRVSDPKEADGPIAL